MFVLLDADQLGERLDRYQHSLFRMETLPEYAVDDDGDDYRRWLRGEPEPTWSRITPWLDMLRADHAAGKVNTRVRLFTEHLTDYQLYAAQWGYPFTSAAGEDIRVLRRGEHDFPRLSVQGDFWLVDDTDLLDMCYDTAGRFEGAELVTNPTQVADYRAIRDATWVAAEPFPRWWARHPELHQRKVAA